MTGRPRSSGRRSSSTDAKNASQSRWAMTRLATTLEGTGATRRLFGRRGTNEPALSGSIRPSTHRGTRLARREDRAGRAEAELLLRRGGQVELAAAHVGPAVDDGDADGAPP